MLSARTLAAIPPGVYSFVKFPNEKFLRLGIGHHILGAKRVVQSAQLIPAIEAIETIWRQGIATPGLQIRDYDQKTVLFELK